ncbi:MAG: LCP family protein [Vulcanimicrobiaceae bacterium]
MPKHMAPRGGSVPPPGDDGAGNHGRDHGHDHGRDHDHDGHGGHYDHPILHNVLMVLGLLVGLVAGAVVTQSLVQHRSPTDVVASDVAPFIVEPPQAHFHKDRIALLLLGIDYNYNEKDEEFSSDARSDTIMAISLNFPTSQNPQGSISILSVPRDTDVVLPNGREDKINAAYADGGNNPYDDAHYSEKVVADFLGIPHFDRFITLRINATKDLIDAIGGIDVVPDETMNYDDNWGHLHIHFIGSKLYHMNGDQAVSYSRFRHDECSDPCRIKRQQQVIRIVAAKLKNDKFNDLLHVNQLISVIRRNTYTDISDREALSLAMAFQHVDLAKLKTEQVAYVADKDLSCCGDVLIADDTAKDALVKKLFLEPIVPSVPPDARAVAAVDPSTVHVDVRNGSGVSGLGAKMAGALRGLGFRVDSVANADSFAYDATEIHVHSATAPLAGERVRQALALKSAVVQPDPPSAGAAPSSDVTVIVGHDYSVSPQHEASAVK